MLLPLDLRSSAGRSYRAGPSSRQSAASAHGRLSRRGGASHRGWAFLGRPDLDGRSSEDAQPELIVEPLQFELIDCKSPLVAPLRDPAERMTDDARSGRFVAGTDPIGAQILLIRHAWWKVSGQEGSFWRRVGQELIERRFNLRLTRV